MFTAKQLSVNPISHLPQLSILDLPTCTLRPGPSFSDNSNSDVSAFELFWATDESQEEKLVRLLTANRIQFSTFFFTKGRF